MFGAVRVFGASSSLGLLFIRDSTLDCAAFQQQVGQTAAQIHLVACDVPSVKGSETAECSRGGTNELKVESIENIRLSIVSLFLSTGVPLGCRQTLQYLVHCTKLSHFSPLLLVSGRFLPIVCSIVLQRRCKLASSLSPLPASYILSGFETCSLHTF